jgi:hypothetical protein
MTPNENSDLIEESTENHSKAMSILPGTSSPWENSNQSGVVDRSFFNEPAETNILNTDLIQSLLHF